MDQETKELTILIAEDDDGHADLIQLGLKRSGIHNPIIRFSNGEETWSFLSEQKNKNKAQSFLLLLDIKMPIMDGIEVLEKIKNNKLLKSIPVIMLTTTDNPREIDHCYNLGCNIYITKPIDFKDFLMKLKRLGLFVQIVKI